jgi:hypothetical protein
MNTKTIKISLINTCSAVVHEGIIVLKENSLNYSLLFTSSVSQDIEVNGHDYFACLINLRIELEKQNYYPLCNGARRDITCGGMQRESSEGGVAYVIRFGEFCDLDDYVDVFEYAEPNSVVSVSEQEEFNKLHRKSLPEIIDYSVQFTEPISCKTRENIIDRLSSYSGWQLLQRKSYYVEYLNRKTDKLSFKFFNTSAQPHWNVEIKISNFFIEALITTQNTMNREAFLTYLNEQLTSNNVMFQISKM